MGEAFLTRRGGGASVDGGVKGAVIGVTFPEGATVSVSNGTKTYTSKDTDGNTAFSVEAGTWTVTAALGEDSDSKEVTVKEGDFVTVEIIFATYIFAEGRGPVETMTSGSDLNGNCEITASSIVFSKTNDYGASAWALTDAPVNASKYDILFCEATCTAQYGGINPEIWQRAIGLYADAGDGASNTASAYTYFDANSTRTLYSVDISQMSGEFYVGSKGIGAAEIHNIWLE